MAIERRGAPAGLIHHSDRGVQYACGEYTEMLTSQGIQVSMSRKGNPYRPPAEFDRMSYEKVPA